jgi:RAVE protein 1 C terminal
MLIGGFTCTANIIRKTAEFIKINMPQTDTQTDETEISQENEKKVDYMINLKIDYEEYKEWLEMDFLNSFNIEQALDGHIQSLDTSLELVDENKLGIDNKNKYLFRELIQILLDNYNNKRGKDAFVCLFATHVKLFNLGKKNIMGLLRQKSLKSKEVIWALHCENKETLLDVCFPKHLLLDPAVLNWEAIRQYCVPLWYDDGAKLKALVEKLAMVEYKKDRNPDNVILYYILLNKLPIVLTLYRS